MMKASAEHGLAEEASRKESLSMTVIERINLAALAVTIIAGVFYVGQLDGRIDGLDPNRHFSPMGPEKAALFGIKRFE